MNLGYLTPHLRQLKAPPKDKEKNKNKTAQNEQKSQSNKAIKFR